MAVVPFQWGHWSDIKVTRRGVVENEVALETQTSAVWHNPCVRYLFHSPNMRCSRPQNHSKSFEEPLLLTEWLLSQGPRSSLSQHRRVQFAAPRWKSATSSSVDTPGSAWRIPILTGTSWVMPRKSCWCSLEAAEMLSLILSVPAMVKRDSPTIF